MSKHTVSLNGIDTGKIGNNKRVKLSEEFPDPSKITTTSEYAKYFDITPEAALSQLGGGTGLTPVLPTGMDAKIDSEIEMNLEIIWLHDYLVVNAYIC